MVIFILTFFLSTPNRSCTITLSFKQKQGGVRYSYMAEPDQFRDLRINSFYPIYFHSRNKKY